MVIKNVFVGGCSVDHVAGCGVKNSFGFSSRTGSIKNEKRIFCVHFLAGTIRGSINHCLVPPHVAPLLHLAIDSGVFGYAPNHDASIHRFTHLSGCAGHGLIRIRFHGNSLGSTESAVSGDQGLALRIHNPVSQGFCGKPTEHNRVHSSNSGACQHGDRRFRNHRHVDRNAIPLLHSPVFENVCKLTHLFVKDAKSDGRIFAGFIPFPNDGGLVGADLEVPVYAVVTNVCLRAREPLDRNGSRSAVVIVSPHLIPLREPMKIVGDLRPESLRVVDAFLVTGPIIVHASDMRSFGNTNWRAYQFA